MASFRQQTFAGGEISPALYGRADLARYLTGARRLRNFLVTPHGSAPNRPGFVYCGETKNSGSVRLIPFTFSDSQSFVLEFGELYVRFWTRVNGVTGVVLSGGVPYELASPYHFADLARLKYSQVGDVVTLTHPNYSPRELRRNSNTNWTLIEVSFDRPGPSAAPSVLLPLPGEDATHPAKERTYLITEIRRDERGVTWESAPYKIDTVLHYGYPLWSPAITYAAGARASATDVDPNGTYYVSRQGGNLNHPLSDTAWWEGPYGSSPPHIYTTPLPASLVCYADRPISLRLFSSYGLVVTDPSFVTYRIYAGKGGMFGWIDDTKAEVYVDAGRTPDYSITPPLGTNPFKVFNPDGSLLRTEYPAVVRNHDQRRVYARTTQRPGFLFLSKPSDYSNFDKHTPMLESDALQFELAAEQFEEIRALVSAKALLVFSSAQEWLVSGSGTNDPISPTSILARPHTSHGSSWLDPIAIGDTVLFLAKDEATVRDMNYSAEKGGMQSRELSLLAQHLLDGYTVVAWAYAAKPHGVVWAVRSDGKLLGLTYLPEHDVWGWHWHDTQGAFEAVTTIPEGAENALYAVVRRTVGGTTKRYLERLSSRRLPVLANGKADTREGIFLDAALTYRGTPATTISGLGHLEGCEVMALADGNVAGPYTVAGGAISLGEGFPDGASLVHVGLAYLPQLETLDLVAQGVEVRGRLKTVTQVGIEVVDSRGLWVGETFDPADTVEWEQRTVADGYEFVSAATDVALVTSFSSWNRHGRICLEQRDPLPLTVLAVTREVELGG